MIEQDFFSEKFLILDYRVSPKNAPTLQCHIFNNVEFDVYTFSTVIYHGLKKCIESIDVADICKSANFERRNNTENYKQDSFRH